MVKGSGKDFSPGPCRHSAAGCTVPYGDTGFSDSRTRSPFRTHRPDSSAYRSSSRHIPSYRYKYSQQQYLISDRLLPLRAQPESRGAGQRPLPPVQPTGGRALLGTDTGPPSASRSGMQWEPPSRGFAGLSRRNRRFGRFLFASGTLDGIDSGDVTRGSARAASRPAAAGGPRLRPEPPPVSVRSRSAAGSRRRAAALLAGRPRGGGTALGTCPETARDLVPAPQRTAPSPGGAPAGRRVPPCPIAASRGERPGPERGTRARRRDDRLSSPCPPPGASPEGKARSLRPLCSSYTAKWRPCGREGPAPPPGPPRPGPAPRGQHRRARESTGPAAAPLTRRPFCQPSGPPRFAEGRDVPCAASERRGAAFRGGSAQSRSPAAGRRPTRRAPGP